jgi:hypothetical protein
MPVTEPDDKKNSLYRGAIVLSGCTLYLHPQKSIPKTQSK